MLNGRDRQCADDARDGVVGDAALAGAVDQSAAGGNTACPDDLRAGPDSGGFLRPSVLAGVEGRPRVGSRVVAPARVQVGIVVGVGEIAAPDNQLRAGPDAERQRAARGRVDGIHQCPTVVRRVVARAIRARNAQGKVGVGAAAPDEHLRAGPYGHMVGAVGEPRGRRSHCGPSVGRGIVARAVVGHGHARRDRPAPDEHFRASPDGGVATAGGWRARGGDVAPGVVGREVTLAIADEVVGVAAPVDGLVTRPHDRELRARAGRIRRRHRLPRIVRRVKGRAVLQIHSGIVGQSHAAPDQPLAPRPDRPLGRAVVVEHSRQRRVGRVLGGADGPVVGGRRGLGVEVGFRLRLEGEHSAVVAIAEGGEGQQLAAGPGERHFRLSDGRSREVVPLVVRGVEAPAGVEATAMLVDIRTRISALHEIDLQAVPEGRPLINGRQIGSVERNPRIRGDVVTAAIVARPHGDAAPGDKLLAGPDRQADFLAGGGTIDAAHHAPGVRGGIVERAVVQVGDTGAGAAPYEHLGAGPDGAKITARHQRRRGNVPPAVGGRIVELAVVYHRRAGAVDHAAPDKHLGTRPHRAMPIATGRLVDGAHR